MVPITRSQASDASRADATLTSGTARRLAGRGEPSGTAQRIETTRPTNPSNTNRDEDQPESLNVLVEGNSAQNERGQGRMRWTRTLNIELMSAYYLATEMETNKTRYRDKLERIWREKYPNSTLTAQRLSDQVRSVLSRKVLTDAELDNVKQAHRRRSLNIRRSVLPAEHNIELQRDELPTVVVNEDETDPEMCNMLSEQELKYQGIPMEARPRLPKP